MKMLNTRQYAAMGIGLCVLILALSTKALPQGMDPALDKWLRENRLGPNYAEEQDWKAIRAAAEKEGKVVIYSSATSVKFVAGGFMKKYPKIRAEGHNLGSVKSAQKLIEESDAGLHIMDVFSSSGAGTVPELLRKNRLYKFVPDNLLKKISRRNREPLLVNAFQAKVWFYNKEAFEKPPIDNMWDLTRPQWKGKVVLKDPFASLSSFGNVATIIQHADEMAKAYEQEFGEKIKLSPGIPNAGYEFFYRLLRNGLIILASGRKVTASVGRRGQKSPPISTDTYVRIRYNKSKNYALGVLADLKPVAGVASATYLGIGALAPHPNAAKLFIRYVMGSDEIRPDMEIPKPYKKGRGFELLQGLAPYYQAGSHITRNDVPTVPGVRDWKTIKWWHVDGDFIRKNRAKIQDFWLKNAGK